MEERRVDALKCGEQAVIRWGNYGGRSRILNCEWFANCGMVRDPWGNVWQIATHMLR